MRARGSARPAASAVAQPGGQRKGGVMRDTRSGMKGGSQASSRRGQRKGRAMRDTQRGFTYLGALFLIVLMGAALAGTGELWSMASQRAKERELLWVGTQYAQALRRYYHNSPGTPQYPLQLEELLEDFRHPTVHRYLRRLYPDPMTGEADWEVMRGFENRIVGIHSRSERMPMKTARFPAQWEAFEGSTSFADWQFVADRHFRDGAPAAEVEESGGRVGSSPPRTPIAPRVAPVRPPAQFR